MKTDPKATVPTLASRAPPEVAPGLLLPVPPIVALIPVAAGEPAFADEVGPAPIQDFNLVCDLSLFARVLRPAQGGRHVLAIFVASIVVTIANMLGQVRLNEWNGQFFDAVGRRDLSAFVYFLWNFLVIIAVLLALTVVQTFLQERLKFRLREWIVNKFVRNGAWIVMLIGVGPAFAITLLQNGERTIVSCLPPPTGKRSGWQRV